jgi:hypothetical protein
LTRKNFHKFLNKPTVRDDIRFASKKESEYYERLKLEQEDGRVLFFLRQVPFHLPGGTKYIVDFVEFHADGTVHFIDVKGMSTPAFLLKKKWVESIYPIEIEVVTKW